MYITVFIVYRGIQLYCINHYTVCHIFVSTYLYNVYIKEKTLPKIGCEASGGIVLPAHLPPQANKAKFLTFVLKIFLDPRPMYISSLSLSLSLSFFLRHVARAGAIV